MPPRLIFQFFLTAAAVFSAGCKKEVTSAALAPTILPVSAVAVRYRPSFPYPVTYYGRVEPARQSALSFELEGRLEEVLVDEGEFVSAGNVVAKLNTSQLEAEKLVLLARRNTESTLLKRLRRGEREEVIAAARSEVKRLESVLTGLAANKGRAEKVFAGRSISRSEYDEAIYSHEAAIYSLDKARRQLEELESGTREEDIDAQASRVAMTNAEIDVLEVRFSKSSIIAPFDGVCVRRTQDEGVSLSPGQTVIEIIEAERLEARFSVPVENLRLAKQAEFLSINGIQYLTNGAREIQRVDETTRTVDLIFPLQTQNKTRILSGQTCLLQIHKRIEDACIELPLSALIPSVRGLWSCYRLLPASEQSTTYAVEKCDVSIIHTDGVSVFVSSTLPDQALIIRKGSHKVKPGMRVRIVGSEPL